MAVRSRASRRRAPRKDRSTRMDAWARGPRRSKRISLKSPPSCAANRTDRAQRPGEQGLAAFRPRACADEADGGTRFAPSTRVEPIPARSAAPSIRSPSRRRCYRRLRKVIWRSAHRPVCSTLRFLRPRSDAADVAKEGDKMSRRRSIEEVWGSPDHCRAAVLGNWV
jgi:hypothetical protein